MPVKKPKHEAGTKQGKPRAEDTESIEAMLANTCFMLAFCLAYSSTLKIEATSSPKHRSIFFELYGVISQLHSSCSFPDCLTFDPEDIGDNVVRNVGRLSPDYTELHHSCLLHADFLLGLLFDSENGDDTSI
jgi:hypothetical protein